MKDGIMTIVEEIYSAADKRGLSLADYIRHTYKGNKLASLELNIRTQLDSLRSDISDFMIEAETDSQAIGTNLLCVNREKLDLMQERVRENLRLKMNELESLDVVDVSVMKKIDSSTENGYALSDSS